MFTRQHYEAIAEMVYDQHQEANQFFDESMRGIAIGIVRHMATSLADYFAKDNPRFDREKFLEACGL
jgi:hypothetical protein